MEKIKELCNFIRDNEYIKFSEECRRLTHKANELQNTFCAKLNDELKLEFENFLDAERNALSEQWSDENVLFFRFAVKLGMEID